MVATEGGGEVAAVGRSKADKRFDWINAALLAVYLVLVLYPLYLIVISSFSDPNRVTSGDVWLWPKGITLEGYRRIFADSEIWRGYGNSLLYTTLGTAINVTLTLTAGYALSRHDLVGRNTFMLMIVFTMFFGGGLIPTYLLVKDLHLLNTMWALMLPNAVGAYNLIVARTFFQNGLPGELLEAAVMDGSSNTRFFLSVALPLSLPITAVMVLFYAVGHWNAFFNALIYLHDDRLFPLQLILRDILISSQVQMDMVADLNQLAEQQQAAELIKYGVIIVASVPVLVLYPFVQKYFVSGVMIGSVKG